MTTTSEPAASPQRRRRDAGVFFAIIAVLLFAVSAYGLALLASTTQQSQTATDNGQYETKVYYGIVGNPNVETDFGYLGDVGDYPASLADLLKNPGKTGWNGPYLKDVRFDNGYLLDSYNSPLEYFTNLVAGSLDQVTVISRGTDHSSTNTASNPNVAAQFAGVFPTNASYSTTTYDTDNVAFPNFFNNIPALNHQNVGTLSYNITNFDMNSSVNAVKPGCAALYTVNVTSVPRGSNDTIALQYSPTVNTSGVMTQGMTSQFVQGAYDVVITSSQTGTPVWTERVAIPSGSTVTRNVHAPPVDSSAAGTTYSVTVYNNSGVTLTLRQYTSAGGSLGTVGNGSSKPYTNVSPCQLLYLTNGTTVYDTFVMGTGNRSRWVDAVGTTPYTFTVTNNGTHSSQLQVVIQGDYLLGTVALRKTQTFSVPRNTVAPAGVPVVVESETGATLQTVTISGNGTAITQ